MRNFVAVSLFSLSIGAQAALPDGVTTAVTAAGTDATSLGGAVLVVMVGIAAILWLRKVLH